MKIKSTGRSTTELQFASGYTVLVSYETPVAYAGIGGAYKTAEYYSVTTSKHINQFLRSNGYTPEDTQTKPQAFFDNLLIISQE